MNDQHGPVYRYLQHRGYALQPAYFQNTGYIIGWEFSTQLYTLTWRQENDVFLVCNIQGTQNQQGLESAMSALIILWKDIINSVEAVREVRGLPGEYGTERERQHRRKMKQLLLRQGARETQVEDEMWLIYP